jgi:hypothetical protein
MIFIRMPFLQYDNTAVHLMIFIGIPFLQYDNTAVHFMIFIRISFLKHDNIVVHFMLLVRIPFLQHDNIALHFIRCSYSLLTASKDGSVDILASFAEPDAGHLVAVGVLVAHGERERIAVLDQQRQQL